MPKSDTKFSVSAAKAFFEAAKRPEVRQAAVAAAKNPFVRDVAKSAAKNPETRNQLIAALEKQYGSKGGDTRTSPAVKPKHDTVAPTPPPPPPHRGAAAYSDAPASYSSSSYSPSISSKPLPPAPSTSSYAAAAPPPSKIGYPSLVNELQELQLNSQGRRNTTAPAPAAYAPPPVASYKDHQVSISGPAKPLRPPPPSSTSKISNAFSPTQPHAIAKYSFTGSHVDELSCSAGDIIVLKRDVDDQWIYGRNNRTGANGIIPLSFLDIVVPLTPATHGSEVMATAIYDYDSNTPGDLTFRMHDQIKVLQRVGPDWLRGSLGGREGIFPANFVSCPGVGSLPMVQPAVQSAAPLEKMTAAYDYASGVSGDLNFNAGDTVEVVARLDQDWIRGRVNGREGLAPLSYLAPYGTPVKSPNSRGIASISALGGTGRTVTAIADHCSDDPNMLYFSKGDRILIVEDVDSYWYRGKVEGFKTLPAGLFPKALVNEG